MKSNLLRAMVAAALIAAFGAACYTSGDGGTLPRDAAGDTADSSNLDGGDASSVECGSMTCGPDEYCVVQKCCGSDPGFNDAGEWQGSDSYSCVSVPEECDPTAPCDCEMVGCGGYGTPQCDGRVQICQAR